MIRKITMLNPIQFQHQQHWSVCDFLTVGFSGIVFRPTISKGSVFVPYGDVAHFLKEPNSLHVRLCIRHVCIRLLQELPVRNSYINRNIILTMFLYYTKYIKHSNYIFFLNTPVTHSRNLSIYLKTLPPDYQTLNTNEFISYCNNLPLISTSLVHRVT